MEVKVRATAVVSKRVSGGGLEEERKEGGVPARKTQRPIPYTIRRVMFAGRGE
jgi:hypothetical protein